MDNATFVRAFDARVDNALFWLGDNAGFLFDAISAILRGTFLGVLWLLNAAPFYVVALVIALIAWRAMSLVAGFATGLALTACALMGLWSETMSTLALVLAGTFLALCIGLPLGVVAGLLPRVNRGLEPVLDLVQTMPPYIYLLPAIALLGFGPATALAATIIVAVPPAVRLTALGIHRTPCEFIELGQASGVTGWQMFAKIRLPFALPSIMAGINQSLMMAFGMVVIAGIVGSGGLGQTIYEAIRRLDIAASVNAAIGIVILTMVLDRITQSAAQLGGGKRHAD